MIRTLTHQLRVLAMPPQLIRKRDTIDAAVARYGLKGARILNVGSKNERFGEACVNFDIVPGPGVDVVGDAHRLSRRVSPASFDAVVLGAVLQYCGNPSRVLQEVHRVLKPRGLLLIDAPFLQPYCPDGPDLWRFTEDGLRSLCEHRFEVLELKPSITAGPALAFFMQAVATERDNRFARVALGWMSSLVAWIFSRIPHAGPRTAGAFLLVGRKIS